MDEEDDGEDVSEDDGEKLGCKKFSSACSTSLECPVDRLAWCQNTLDLY